MIPFILGIFVGATLGIFIMSWFAVGALSDLQTKISLLERR